MISRLPRNLLPFNVDCDSEIFRIFFFAVVVIELYRIFCIFKSNAFHLPSLIEVVREREREKDVPYRAFP